MRRGLYTILTLGFALALSGQFECVRTKGFTAVASSAASHCVTHPLKHLDDANNTPDLLSENTFDGLSERDDDETWSPGNRDLWTNDFLFRPIESVLTCLTSQSRRDASRIVHSPPPLRC